MFLKVNLQRNQNPMIMKIMMMKRRLRMLVKGEGKRWGLRKIIQIGPLMGLEIRAYEYFVLSWGKIVLRLTGKEKLMITQ